MVLGNNLILAVGMTIALDKSTGDLIWKTKDYHGGYSSPIAFKHGNQTLLAIFNTLGLVIKDSKDGKEIANAEWKTDYNVNAVTPIIHGDNIFISSGYNTGGALYQFDGKTLTQLWKNKNMRNHFNSCVLWDGYLYGIDENQLRCLDFQTGEANHRSCHWLDGTADRGRPARIAGAGVCDNSCRSCDSGYRVCMGQEAVK